MKHGIIGLLALVAATTHCVAGEFPLNEVTFKTYSFETNWGTADINATSIALIYKTALMNIANRLEGIKYAGVNTKPFVVDGKTYYELAGSIKKLRPLSGFLGNYTYVGKYSNIIIEPSAGCNGYFNYDSTLVEYFIRIFDEWVVDEVIDSYKVNIYSQNPRCPNGENDPYNEYFDIDIYYTTYERLQNAPSSPSVR